MPRDLRVRTRLHEHRLVRPPLALVALAVQLHAPAVADTQVVARGPWEAEARARLLQHLREGAREARAALDQGAVPSEELRVAAVAGRQREAMAAAQGLQQVAVTEGRRRNGCSSPIIEDRRKLFLLSG